MELGKLGLWCAMDGVPLSQQIEVAQRLESLGYSALWLPMTIRHDTLITASALLDHTERLVLATGIATIYERAPAVMVAGQRSLHEQSGGRFLLGLGVSHGPIVEAVYRRAYEPPLTAMRRYLDEMDAGISFGMGEGDAGGAPPPGRGELPRVLAAMGPRMLELARDRALGSHPYFMPPEHTARARELLGPDALLCPEVKVVFDTDAARARDRARAAGATNIQLPNYQNNWKRFGFEDADFADGGSDRLIDATVARGDEEAIRAFLARHFDAGATHVCIHSVGEGPMGGPPDWKVLELLAPAND